MRTGKLGMAAFAMVLALGLIPGLAGTLKAEDWKLGVGLRSNSGGGVRIARVYENSPAEAIGLRPGQVILTIDGVLFNDPFEVRNKIFNGSGSSVDIVFQDGGSFYQVTAELEVVSAVVADAYGGKPMMKKKIKAYGLKKIKVSDPRRRR